MHDIEKYNLSYIYIWFLNITIMIEISLLKIFTYILMKTHQIFILKICFQGPLFDCLFQGPDFISCFFVNKTIIKLFVLLMFKFKLVNVFKIVRSIAL